MVMGADVERQRQVSQQAVDIAVFPVGQLGPAPLLLNSRDVAMALAEKLSARLSGAVHVELAMSYGNPSIDAALQNLHANYVRRIVVLPMYPQYSNTTTGSVFEAVTRKLARRRWIPEFRFINHYHDSKGYISALAASIRDHWDVHGRGERLLFSFHGVPRRTLLSGDPYHCHCQKTARLVAEALELDDDAWQVSFQSRVGREEWLKPYRDQTLAEWGGAGIGTAIRFLPFDPPYGMMNALFITLGMLEAWGQPASRDASPES